MKWPQDFINKVIWGDALEIMKKIPNESIDMAITSPPYYGLRDYGIKGQLGLEGDPDEYIKKLVMIFRELKRILKKSGSLYLNLGDVYYSPNIVKEKSNWLQAKQLMQMPARIAIALQEDGWILRNDIIYHKRNYLPSSVKDRLTNTYEHIYFFVKDRKYFYDLDSIREPCTTIKTKGKTELKIINSKRHDERAVLSRKQGLHTFYNHSKRGLALNNPLGKNPGDIIHTPEGNFLLGSTEYADWYFNKRQKGDWKSEGEKVRYVKGNKKDVEQYPHPYGSNPGDFWTMPVRPFHEAHFAVYPEEICIRPIKASCPELVCKKCGKPAMKKVTGKKGFGNSFNIRVRDMKTKPDKWGCLCKATIKEKKEYDEKDYGSRITRRETFKKCDCNAGFEPGIVLDMFAGSGTTGVVARKLGRRYVLIDLKPEYCKMAKKRLANIIGIRKKGIDIE